MSAAQDEKRRAPRPKRGRRPKRGASPKRSRGERARAERPPFAGRYPDDPNLERLLVAFEAGHFAFVRRESRRLRDHTADPSVRDAARDLARRVEPDRVSIVLWALGVSLMVFLYAFYLAAQHH